MKVFITGATGFVGTEILQQLQQSGHSIRILARNQKSTRVQACASRFGAEVYEGNILAGDSLPAGLKNCDAVIHLIGIISEIGANTFENVHAFGTRNVVSAAKQAGVKRFVHMSALG